MLKKIILPFTLACVSFFAFSQKKDSVFSSSSLQKATVYFGSGSQLMHLAKVSLNNGTQYVVIKNVATDLDINTIQINCPEQVTLLSYAHRIFEEPYQDNVIILIRKWNDSIKVLNKESDKLGKNNIIIDQSIQSITQLITNNFTTPDKKNINGEELIKLTNYYTDKVSALREKSYLLQEQRNNIAEKIADLNQKIQQAEQDATDGKTKKSGQLILHVMSSMAGTIPFECSYFTPNAGWIPTYEVRVKSSDNSMKLAYKALVSQHTGIEWKNVKLTLCTGSPMLNNYIPDLMPTYLQFYTPVLYRRYAKARMEKDEVMSAMPQMAIESNEMSDTMEIKMIAPDVSSYLEQKENHLNLNYEISLPYDIPSDDKAYSIHIKEEKLNAIYEHIAIPKMDGDAFFSAKIGNWGDLNILPGESNIILDNNYIGKSFLNPQTADDSMRISLGRDRSISINRKQIKDYTAIKKQDIKTDTHTFEISVKNNKNRKVTMVLKDQFPISKLKEIEILLIENGGGSVNNETGILEWNLSLDAGESKKFRFQYQVKYPKDKTLVESN